MEARELRDWLRERRHLVVVPSGLALVLAKRLVDWEEPLAPNLLLYLAVPLFLAWLLSFEWREVGMALPEDRRGWALVAVLVGGAVALALVGSLFPSMTEYYPVEHWGEVEPTAASMVPYETAILLIMLSVETLYRGWLVLAASERLGYWAVLVSAVPYALAHLSKPWEEVVFSLFAGIAFGLADLWARSIVPSLAGHFVGSALFDCLALQG